MTTNANPFDRPTATRRPPTEKPPPYTQDPSPDEQQLFLSQLRHRNALHSPSHISPSASAAAARLRNFLHFCLATDYRTSTTITLPASDRAHFATLKTILDDLQRTSTTNTLPNASESAQPAPYFWYTLHTPCSILGIPAEMALDSIMRFFRYQGRYGNYKGCLRHLAHGQDLDVLAVKLVLDREIMIPKVVPVGEREGMFGMIDRVGAAFFESLSGIRGRALSYEVLFGGGGDMAREAQMPAFVLNERGRKYVEGKLAVFEFESVFAEKGSGGLWGMAMDGIHSLLWRAEGGEEGEGKGAVPSEFGLGGGTWLGTYHVPDFFTDRNRRNYTSE